MKLNEWMRKSVSWPPLTSEMDTKDDGNTDKADLIAPVKTQVSILHMLIVFLFI